MMNKSKEWVHATPKELGDEIEKDIKAMHEETITEDIKDSDLCEKENTDSHLKYNGVGSVLEAINNPTRDPNGTFTYSAIPPETMTDDRDVEIASLKKEIEDLVQTQCSEMFLLGQAHGNALLSLENEIAELKEVAKVSETLLNERDETIQAKDVMLLDAFAELDKYKESLKQLHDGIQLKDQELNNCGVAINDLHKEIITLKNRIDADYRTYTNHSEEREKYIVRLEKEVRKQEELLVDFDPDY